MKHWYWHWPKLIYFLSLLLSVFSGKSVQSFGMKTKQKTNKKITLKHFWCVHLPSFWPWKSFLFFLFNSWLLSVIAFWVPQSEPQLSFSRWRDEKWLWWKKDVTRKLYSVFFFHLKHWFISFVHCCSDCLPPS